MAEEFPVRVKDPDSEEDFPVNWTKYLAPSNDTLVSAEWIVPAPLAITRQSVASPRAIVWLTGGKAGKTYTITCRVTTALGRTSDQSVRIQCQQR